MPDASYFFEHQVQRPLISGNETTKEQLDYVKYQVSHNRLLLNRFINSGATSTAFYVELKPMSKQALYKAEDVIEKVIQEYQPRLDTIYQAGWSGLESALAKMSQHDITVLGSIAVLLLVIIYGAFFRQVLMGLVPFCTSAMAVVWSLGILAYIDIPINVLCAVILVIVFVVGAMECAHFINAYQRSYTNNPEQPKEHHAAYSLRHVFWPIFFAALTTILGFLFNTLTSINLLVDFAIAISVGIFLNTIVVCFLVPLLLEFFLAKKNVNKQLGQLKNRQDGKGFFALLLRLVISIYEKTVARSKSFILVIFSIVVLGIALAPKIPTEIIPYINFYRDSPVMQKIYDTTKLLTGTRRFSIYINGTEPQAFADKENLRILLSAEQEINQLPETSSTISVASVLAALRQVYLDEGEDMSQYQIPDSTRFLNALLPEVNNISFAGKLLAKNYQAAKITVYYQVYSTAELTAYLDKVNRVLENNFKNTSMIPEVQNTTIAVAQEVQQVFVIQLISICIIYLGIFMVMLAVFKSFKAGIVSVIPNFFPLACIIIFMYVFNIPFYPVTIIILAAVLGLAVDNTIHIMLAFRKFYLETKEVDSAIRQAVHGQFRPVTVTSIALIVGVSVLAFSSLKSTMLFAVLLGFGSLMAWVADMIITPFLLNKINIVKKLN